MVPLFVWPRAGNSMLRSQPRPIRFFSNISNEIQHAVRPKFRLDHLDLTINEPRVPSYSLAVVKDIAHPTPTVRMLRLRALAGAEAVHMYESLSATEYGASFTDLIHSGKIHIDLHQPFRYNAGQWVDFAIPSVPVVGGYSIVSSPLNSEEGASDMVRTVFENDIRCARLPYFDLAVKIGRHPPAAWVHSKAKVNDIVAVRPGGSFCLSSINAVDPVTGEQRYNHLVLIAGGVGINPLYSMLLSLAWDYSCRHSLPEVVNSKGAERISPPFKITLIYSCRNRAEVLFLQQLQELYSNVLKGLFRVHITLTRESHEYQDYDVRSGINTKSDLHLKCQWDPTALYRGRINKDLIARAIFENEQGHVGTIGSALPSSSVFQAGKTGVVVCGPPTMTDSIVEVCTSAGISACDIHYEKWW